MILLNIFETTLPLTNPVLKFFLILIIILFAPIILNRIKIPPLLGLIIAGAIIGPKGLNLIERDSGIILSGTAGLLYIMFLAGLEIDLVDFKKNSHKSIVFGLYTFIIPMIMGYLGGIYILNFPIPTSILFASLFASHTLITYPLISKLGVVKNKAVNMTVGGTMITDILSLLVLAIIVDMKTKGEVTTEFWIRLSISVVIFGVIILFLFPIVSRWFFKRYHDSVSQYIFVLAMVFLGAVLAEIAGIEGIIGAFLTGLSFNKLIPHTSPLMNRVDFVGNAIFIPFFLIGTGMLIDFRVFYKDLATIKVAIIMIIIATSSKFIAAWVTQKTFKFSLDERRLIFGLSNARVAATLAAVLVGYNIVLGQNELGEPIRLLNESVLNGTILMILVSCTIASFIAQKGALNIVAQSEDNEVLKEVSKSQERILITIRNSETTNELVNLGLTVKSKENKEGLYALSIINNYAKEGSAHKKATRNLNKASETASAADNVLHELLRYDLNIVNGITSVVKEQNITDLILGLHIKRGISNSFLGNLTEGILSTCNTTTLIYRPEQPIGTIKRHIVVVPEKAELEKGFPIWLKKVWNIAQNSGAKLVFYATNQTLDIIKEIQLKHPIEVDFIEFNNWDHFLILSRFFKNDDNLIIILSRKNNPSYHSNMTKLSFYLNTYFKEKSLILIYPIQNEILDNSNIDLKNVTLIEPIEKLDEILKTVVKVFKNRS